MAVCSFTEDFLVCSSHNHVPVLVREHPLSILLLGNSFDRNLHLRDAWIVVGLRVWTEAGPIAPGAGSSSNNSDLAGVLRLMFQVTSLLLPAALRAPQACRYLIYSEADFEVFRPTGATSCTDGGEIWHGGGTEGPLPWRRGPKASSMPNFTPIGATTRV